MSAAKYNLSIPRSTTFERQFQILDGTNTPFDLTGYTLKSEIRVAATDVTASGEFIVTALPTPGYFSLALPASSSINLTQSCYVYDIRMISGSSVTVPIGGKVTFANTVTR